MVAQNASLATAGVEPARAEHSGATMLSVVIPALNEEGGIADIVCRVEAVRPALASAGVEGLEIIVVDDGSRDRTAEIASSYSFVRLVRHPVNQGYGAAIKTGFGCARGELLAFLDADGTYPPEALPDLCRVAMREQADVVVGSRRSGGASEMPPVRRLGNFMWSSLLSTVGNRRVADPASGMRVVRRSALRRLYPLPDGLNFTPVMSTRSAYEDLRVVELPIHYRERVGRSKLSVVRDGTRFLKTILWTALEYNPARVLGLVGIGAMGVAAAVALAMVVLRLQGVTQLGTWGVFSLFTALVLAVMGVSIFSLGATFNYLVSLQRGEVARQGLFGRPIFGPSLDHHFGWIGLAAMVGGAGLGAASLALSASGWEVSRLWFWLLASASAILVGLQLVVSWILMRVLESLSARDARIGDDLARSAADSVSVPGASPDP